MQVIVGDDTRLWQTKRHQPTGRFRVDEMQTQKMTPVFVSTRSSCVSRGAESGQTGASSDRDGLGETACSADLTNVQC